jgi:serine/threonine-protein kinase
VLLGSVRRSGDRVRIAARLVETATGYYLWSETYDRQVQDIFAIQEEIARSIVGTLTSALNRWSPAIAGRQTGSFEAYTYYLKGRHFAARRSPEGLRKAVECFEAAIAADERSALAHAGLADMYCLLADYGLMHPRDAMPRAKSAVLEALELAPHSAEAHCSYGLIRSLYDWQWEEAEAFYLRSLELNPGYATAHHWYAIDYLAMLGRFEQAEREISVACRLDPLSMIIQEGPAYLLTISRRYDEAIESFRDLIRRAPDFYKLYTSLGRAHSLKGDYGEAIGLLQKGRGLAGDVPNILGALGQTYALAGRPAEARGLLQELGALAAERYVPSTCFALIHAGLGENAEALQWLERGCEAHELPLTSLKVHPAYDGLRQEPRFDALLRTMRLS